MKTTKFHILIFSFFFFSACNMEELPKAQIASPAVFGSESGLAMYTNSFYEVFPNRTQTILNNQNYAVNTTIAYLTTGGYSANESDGWGWETLRNINYFIVNCNYKSVPEVTRNNYLGIAKFFRAYFYFNMMVKFGDLPWINHPLDVGDPILYAGRDPRALIADSIKADLNFAISNIIKAKDASASTITKSVAAAFKSRVCLWEGTFRKYHTEADLMTTANDWLQESVSAAEVVMGNNYSLYNTGTKPYQDIFLATTPLSAEVIYAVTFNASKVHQGNRYWTSPTFSIGPSLVRPFVNTYLMTDGTFYTSKPNYATEDFVTECKDRDKRLAQTIRTPSYTRNGAKTPPDYLYSVTGYMPCKFTLEDKDFDSNDLCTNNVVLFRYAEVLLNYAEAKAEMSTLTDADWEKTIGALRTRGGITSGLTTKPMAVDLYLKEKFFPDISDAVILEIRRERNIELFNEGLEWNDIVRWKLGKQLTKRWEGINIPALDTPLDMNNDGINDTRFYTTTKPEPIDKVTDILLLPGERRSLGEDGHTLLCLADRTRTWDDKLYFFPIPALDLTKNPNLGQNPGWK